MDEQHEWLKVPEVAEVLRIARSRAYELVAARVSRPGEVSGGGGQAPGVGTGAAPAAADTLEGSRHPNMKELRPLGSNIRVLFAFDPRRAAILLIGGDKTDRWREWYEEMIPVAD